MKNSYIEKPTPSSDLPLFAYAERLERRRSQVQRVSYAERHVSRSYGVSYYNAKIIAEMQGYGAGGRYGEA